MNTQPQLSVWTKTHLMVFTGPPERIIERAVRAFNNPSFKSLLGDEIKSAYAELKAGRNAYLRFPPEGSGLPCYIWPQRWGEGEPDVPVNAPTNFRVK